MKLPMTLIERIDEIDSQLDSTSPYYLPALLRDVRAALATCHEGNCHSSLEWAQEAGRADGRAVIAEEAVANLCHLIGVLRAALEEVLHHADDECGFMGTARDAIAAIPSDLSLAGITERVR